MYLKPKSIQQVRETQKPVIEGNGVYFDEVRWITRPWRNFDEGMMMMLAKEFTTLADKTGPPVGRACC